MARDARRKERSGVAPGRGKPRARATSRTTTKTANGDDPVAERAPDRAERTARTLLGGARVTRRALALAAVLVLLLFSYVGSLQVYLKQQHDMGVYQQQIDDHTAANAELQDKLDRWNDDAYVRAQARTRLGWVMPGETGYVVLGPDNQPVEGSNQLGTKAGLQSNANMTWWQKLWDSLFTADQPTPPEQSPGAPIGPASAAPTKR